MDIKTQITQAKLQEATSAQDVAKDVFDLNIKNIKTDEKVSNQLTVNFTATCFCTVASCIRC